MPPYHAGVTDEHAVNLYRSGPPNTVLPDPDADAGAALDAALAAPDPRAALADVVARWPRYLDAWARLGDAGRDTVERYAYYRVGYHRGLDALRASGWRGSGYVRWADETNRGFLRALRGLAQTAAVIGESDEAERCQIFLAQLEPSGVPTSG